MCFIWEINWADKRISNNWNKWKTTNIFEYQKLQENRKRNDGNADHGTYKRHPGF